MSTPLQRVATLGAALVLGSVGLAACGSNNDSSSGGSGSSSSSGGGTSASSSSGGGSGTVTAACKLTTPPTSGASPAPSGGSTAQVSGKVGVILPDTTSSTRYTLYDQPLLQSALSAAGITPDIQNAGGSTDKFTQIAQSMINEGVKVLIIDSPDPSTGAGVEKLADTAGVPVIDYDRINLGGTAKYYVSFDNEDVGKLQAQTMVDCLTQEGVTDPNIIMMDGGTDVDNNAVLFKKGAHEVLDPLVSAGKLKITEEAVVKGWKVENAAPAFQQAFTAAGSQADGVLAANDDIANAVIGVLKTQGLNGKVVVTGQDSGVEGLQNIIEGQQSMTIFKNVTQEAGAAAQLAIAIIGGTDPSAAGLTLSPFDDPQSPSHQIQALLLPSQVITQANVEDVVTAGALKAADICKGIESDCTALGVQ